MTTQRTRKKIDRYSWPLTSAVSVNRNDDVCLDTSTGKLTTPGVSTTLVYVGKSQDKLTGDGTTLLEVMLPAEASCVWELNDTAPNNIAASDIGNEVYWGTGGVVSKASAGASKAGRVLDVDSTATYILVQVGLAITGPTGSAGYTGQVTSRTALAAIAAASRTDGQVVRVLADSTGANVSSSWMFVAASTLAQDGLTVEGSNIVIQPGSGTGRWVRMDQRFVAKIPIDKTLADAAQLMLVPAGYSVKIDDDLVWDITTGFTGGSSSAIGISSSDAGSSTKGDLLGGAGGDVTATLGTAGVKQGTAGAKMDTIAHRRALRIEATEYLRFDRITSLYTAGAGYVHVPMSLSRIG